MTDENEEFIFANAFLRRTKEARERTAWTQEFVAQALGVPLERYKKYEQRTLMPHYLLDHFCTLVGVDIEWLMTGRRRAVAKVEKGRRA